MKHYNEYSNESRWTTLTSPIGDIIIVGDDRSIQLISFQYSFHKYKASTDSIKEGITPQTAKVISYLKHYFSTDPLNIPFVTKLSSGTSRIAQNVKDNEIVLDCSIFTKNEFAVYRKLLTIKAGKAISYGELAKKSGLPNAGRFVGTTMAKNLFPILIPCHRVIKMDGSIGKYSGGPGKKDFLLKHEGYS